MSFAASNDFSNGVGFTGGVDEGTWVAGSSTFVGLDDADQQVLSDWLARAEARGIDSALDLSVRPWGVSGAGVIIGVFNRAKTGRPGLLSVTTQDGRSRAAAMVSFPT